MSTESMSGKVVSGVKKGRSIGFPTINIELEKENIDVEFGVHAVFVIVEGSQYKAIMHFGTKSIGTDDPNKIFCEIHVFDFNEDLYNKEVQVQVLKKIRNVRQFESEKELKEQIQKDIEIANNYFKNA